CGIGKLITEGGCRACAYDIQHAVVIADRPRIVGGVKRLSFGVYTEVHLLRRAVIVKRGVVHRDKARFWSGEYNYRHRGGDCLTVVDADGAQPYLIRFVDHIVIVE